MRQKYALVTVPRETGATFPEKASLTMISISAGRTEYLVIHAGGGTEYGEESDF